MTAGLFPAWRLLVVAGLKNRVRRQLRRLRQPRYLIASLVGVAYLFWVFFLQRRGMGGGPRGGPPDFPAVLELMFVGFGLLSVLATWVFGSDRASLSFSEAEAQFLFPAPYSRRELLRFRVLRSLSRTVFSAAITTFFMSRAVDHPLFFFVGAFFALGTLMLHVTAASFAREALSSAGLASLWRRLLPIALLLLALIATGYLTWRRAAPFDPAAPDGWLRWASALLDTAPLSWALYPIRAPVTLALAPTLGAFVTALPGALLVLALHYLWLVRSDVRFEEASLRAAERRARWLEARRTNAPSAPSPGSVKSARLAVGGAPEWAIVWKNLLAARRVHSLRALPALLFVALALAGSSLVLIPQRPTGASFAIGFFCALAAVLLVVVGPSAVRVDLRQDLPALDVLRAWPLTGFQVLRAELGGAALALGALQWLLLTAAFGFTAGTKVAWLEPTDRGAVLAALLLLCPSLSLAGLTVQNAAALLFPSWVSSNEPQQQRGIEVMGQRLLTLLGTWIALGLVILPVGGAGAGIALLLFPLLGSWALAAGAAVSASLLVGGAVTAAWALGRAFDRLDVTA